MKMKGLGKNTGKTSHEMSSENTDQGVVRLGIKDNILIVFAEGGLVEILSCVE